MPYLVYKIANTVNDKLYVGTTTTTLERRWRSHCHAARARTARGHSTPLYVAMREYGCDKFFMALIEECRDEKTMFDSEAIWIRRLHSAYPQGYNLLAPLTAQEAAIIKYNAFGWDVNQYANFYGLTVGSIRQMRAKPPYNSYPHASYEHLPLNIQQLRQIGKELQAGSHE